MEALPLDFATCKADLFIVFCCRSALWDAHLLFEPHRPFRPCAAVHAGSLALPLQASHCVDRPTKQTKARMHGTLEAIRGSAHFITHLDEISAEAEGRVRHLTCRPLSTLKFVLIWIECMCRHTSRT